MNTFGRRLRFTSFGESHGAAIGGVVDGYPAGIKIDFDLINQWMADRRPGGKNASQRKESDAVEFLSGISPDGLSLGTPIAFVIKNNDVRCSDYDLLKDAFRPGHADFTYMARYGIRDHRGGGRASARETAVRVVAGALAMHILQEKGIEVKTFLTQVGKAGDTGLLERLARNPETAHTYEVTAEINKALEEEIEKAAKDGDSIGGKVTCIALNFPAGIGNPVYDKLNSRLAEAMIGINAAKSFELGLGASFPSHRGSEVIDEMEMDQDGKIFTLTNFSGGIQGGISNGMPIVFNVGFKPTPTIARPLPLLKQNGEKITALISGRHDPCVALRGAAVVKAMCAFTLADFLLQIPPESV